MLVSEGEEIRWMKEMMKMIDLCFFFFCFDPLEKKRKGQGCLGVSFFEFSLPHFHALFIHEFISFSPSFPHPPNLSIFRLGLHIL